MSADWVLGVDFGTTTTAAATRLISERRADLLRFGDGYRMPSAVLVDDDGSLVVGPHVDQEAALYPDRVERRPKQQIGYGSVFLAGAWHEDVDLVAAVLSRVRAEALRIYNNRPPAAVCLTHPVRWETTRTDKLRAAAALAGLGEVTLCTEPVAAAAGLLERGGQSVLHKGDRVAVFDFGGGTLDIALLDLQEGFEPFGPPGGDDHLGGEDINDRLVQFIVGKLDPAEARALLDPESSDDPQMWERAAYRMAAEVRLAKESLSERRLVRMPMPSPPLRTASLELSEQDLLAVVGSVVRTAVERMDAVLQRAGLTADELSAIYLVGGSSRLALVQRMLGNHFGIPIATFGDPKGLIALGAAELTLTAGPEVGPPISQEAAARSQPKQSAQPSVEPPKSTQPAAVAVPRERITSSGMATISVGDAVRAFGGEAWSAPSVIVDRWLVSPRERVALGAPLAVVRATAASEPFVVHSAHSAVLRSLRVSTGTPISLDSPLVEFGQISAMLDLGTGHGYCGILLDIGQAPVHTAGNGGADVLVRIRGVATPGLWWGRRFLLPTKPGRHAVTVSYSTSRRWAGTVSCFATVEAQQWTPLHYEPPSRPRGNARLDPAPNPYAVNQPMTSR